MEPSCKFIITETGLNIEKGCMLIQQEKFSLNQNSSIGFIVHFIAEQHYILLPRSAFYCWYSTITHLRMLTTTYKVSKSLEFHIQFIALSTTTLLLNNA